MSYEKFADFFQVIPFENYKCNPNYFSHFIVANGTNQLCRHKRLREIVICKKFR